MKLFKEGGNNKVRETLRDIKQIHILCAISNLTKSDISEIIDYFRLSDLYLSGLVPVAPIRVQPCKCKLPNSETRPSS
jgi:hypothetical protein